MQNIAEFQIIGRVGGIDAGEKVTQLRVAANYNRKDGDEWVEDTYWNRVTCFGQIAERVKKAKAGDLVRVIGRVRQSTYEVEGERKFGVDLIADGFAVLAPKANREEGGG